jgi:recombination protein RecT
MAKAKEKTEQAMQRTSGKSLTFKGYDSKQLEDVLGSYKAQISQLLPRSIDPAKFISVAVTLIARNPKLQECTQRSILGALLQASNLGLDLSPQLGQACIVPYRDNKSGEVLAEFQIMYRGLVSLMKDAGEINHVESHVVYDGDDFIVELGMEPKLIHKPNLNGDRRTITNVYGVMTYRNGMKRFDFMTPKEVNHIRARSKSYQSTHSPWKTDPAEMWKKSMLKRMSKMEKMPLEKLYAMATDESVIPIDAFNALTKQPDLDQITPGYVENGEIPPKPPKNAPEPPGEPKTEKTTDTMPVGEIIEELIPDEGEKDLFGPRGREQHLVELRKFAEQHDIDLQLMSYELWELPPDKLDVAQFAALEKAVFDKGKK